MAKATLTMTRPWKEDIPLERERAVKSDAKR
jgi:hypothetical protein